MKTILFLKLLLTITLIPSFFFAQHKETFCTSCAIINGTQSVTIHCTVPQTSYEPYKEAIQHETNSFFSALDKKLERLNAINYTRFAQEQSNDYYVYIQVINRTATPLTWQYALRVLRNAHHAAHLLFATYELNPLVVIESY